MAELKTLNGYEIVDEIARNTKQNKILYGESDPSNTLGANCDIYVALDNNRIKQDIVDLIYQIGSIYISMNSANLSTLFSSTQEAFGQGGALIRTCTGNDVSTSLSFTYL